MIDLRSRYKSVSKDEQEKKRQTEEQLQQHRAELKRIGQACLSDPKFQKYKETFYALERLTFDQVRRYKNPDPIQYAMTISNMLTELNAFEALMEDVASDASKQIEEKKRG